MRIMKEGSQPGKFSVEDESDSKLISHENLTRSRHQFHEREDPKWATYLKEEIDEEKPKVPIIERMKLIEDTEEKQRKEAYERGLKAWKATDTPNIEGKKQLEPTPQPVPKPAKPRKKDIEAKRIEHDEGLEEITEKEDKSSTNKKRKDKSEHEEEIKKWREQQPLEYFWKPDPLFYMHLTQLGYSRAAVEKALYYTDNKSVDLAEKYIEEHPDISPLTKEEVMADAEAFLNNIRTNITPMEDCIKNSPPSEDELKTGNETREMDQETPEMIFGKDEMEHTKGDEEEVTLHPEEKVKIKELIDSPTLEENVELLFMINPQTGLSSASLAMEFSKVTVKIMEELQKDKWKKLNEDWTKERKCMNVYQTDGPFHLYQLQNKIMDNGYLHYLAEISNPRSPDITFPVVLGILTQKKCVRKLCPRLSQVN